MSTDRILNQLDLLAYTWLAPRGVGHTQAMLKGLLASDHAMLLTHSMAYGRGLLLPRLLDAPISRSGRVVTLDTLNNLRGMNRPLLADHYALGQLLHKAAATIRHLELKVEVEEAKRALDR